MDDNTIKPNETTNSDQIIEVKTPTDTPLIPTVEADGDPPVNNQDNPVESTPSLPEQPANEAPAPQMPPAPHKASAPVAAIVAAILVAIGLAAVTVYAYQKTQNDSKAAKTNTSTQTELKSTAKEVDQTAKEIDSTLTTTDDAKDFPESEITDQSLGL